jgi:DNA-binding transcriptional MerR regulator
MDINKKKKGYKKYKLETILNNLEVVKQLKANGATNAQIAKHFKVSDSAFYNYINQSPELAEALSSGVVEMVHDLEGELYRKAMKHTLTTTRTFEKNGEITTETTVKEVDGDLGAIIFLLKNLAPDKWVNEPNMLEIKKKELELKEKALEQNLW